MKHEFLLTIYYSDTDAGGVVYHANFLRFCEHARANFFQQIGAPLTELMSHNLGFTVKHCTLNFHSPLVFGDEVIVESHIKEIGTTKIIFAHRLINKHTQVLSAEVDCVTIAINSAYQKQEISADLKERLRIYCHP